MSQTGRRELKHLFRSHDLEIIALNCPLRRGLDVPENQEARIDYLRQVMTLAFDLGPRCIVVQPGPLILDDKDPRHAFTRDALLALGQHGDRVGTNVALETGLDTAETTDQFLNLINTGSLGVCYTPANLLLHGHEAYSFPRLMKQRILQVHATDARSAGTSRMAQDVPLGRGDLDWMQLLANLAEIEYSGWVTALRDASLSVGFLKALIG